MHGVLQAQSQATSRRSVSGYVARLVGDVEEDIPLSLIFVIPGRRASDEPQMCNCTSGISRFRGAQLRT
jgi:hypothetical protein